MRICEQCGNSLGKSGGFKMDGIRYNFHMKCQTKVKKTFTPSNKSNGRFFKKPKIKEVLPDYKFKHDGLLTN